MVWIPEQITFVNYIFVQNVASFCETSISLAVHDPCGLAGEQFCERCLLNIRGRKQNTGTERSRNANVVQDRLTVIGFLKELGVWRKPLPKN